LDVLYKLHCGGNDANFTLKALSPLAIRKCVGLGQTGFEGTWAVMKEIALSSLPNRVLTPKKINNDYLF
jgi:hypothetical protein